MTADLELRKAQLAADPVGRLRWQVLRAFGVLPSERRARALTDRQLTDCALQLILDREGPAAEGAVGRSFDMGRFKELAQDG